MRDAHVDRVTALRVPLRVVPELPAPAPATFVLSRGRVIRAIVAVWLPLAALSVAGQLYVFALGGKNGLIPQNLNVDSEQTPWSYFQSTLLLSCASLLAAAAYIAHRSGGRWVKHWTFLSLALLYVSFDELAAVHDRAIPSLREHLHPHGILYFGWVAPAMVIVAVLGLTYVRFLLNLPRPIAKLFVLAGVVYVAGALGGDLVGGWWTDHHGLDNLTYSAMTQVEENLETAGMVLFVFTMLTHLRGVMPEWVTRLER